MADQKISAGTLSRNFLYHHFQSGIRSFFSKSSADIQEDDDVSSNNTEPVPSLSIYASDIGTQIFLNSNSSSNAETSMASPTFPNHPSIIKSPCKGHNSSSIITRVHAKEEIYSSSMSVENDAKEAKRPCGHDSDTSNLKSINISSPTLESSSTPQGKETDRVNENSKQTVLHPIIWNFRNQELGRHMLLLAIPMIVALSTFNNPKNVSTPVLVTATVALSIGVALIWNGILLRETLRKVSNCIEILGVAFMLLSFYRFVACLLPLTLIWIPVMCWLLNLLPFAVAYFSTERVLENGDTIPTSTNL